MITIPAARLKSAWAVLKRCYDIRGSQSALPVQFQASSSGLRLRAIQHQLAVEHHLPGSFQDASLVLPLETLAACTEGRQGEVTFRPLGRELIQASWENRGIPRSREVQALDWPGGFPAAPPAWTSQPASFRPALREAMNTAAKEGNRYALNCVQLRGAAGQLIGTDSVQLLVQSGFEFPFEEDLLIPVNKVFQQGQELDASVPLDLGVGPDHLAIRSGEWSFWLPLQRDLRFPQVASLIPSADRVTCRVSLSPQDREFLAGALSGLPGNEDKHTPITLDLNGQVRLRASDASQTQPTELVLSGSSATGEPLCVSSSRDYLQRALRLGFAQLQFQGQEHPICCSDGSRHMVWMALGKDSIVPAAGPLTRIQSPGVPAAIPAARTPRTARTPQAASVTVALSPGLRQAPVAMAAPTAVVSPAAPTARPLTCTESDAGSEPQSLGELLEQAVELREALKTALAGFRRLETGLRNHRRRNRQMQQTLRSLRELQASDF